MTAKKEPKNAPLRSRLCYGCSRHDGAATAGITLIELTVTLAIVALIIGVSFPAISSGIDSVRLATATSNVASFLNGAVNRAERHQQAMEVVIKEDRLAMYSNEPGFTRELPMPDGIRIEAVQPEGLSRLVIMPGATVPGIGIQLGNRHGGKRLVKLDPMTGFPRVESVHTE